MSVVALETCRTAGEMADRALGAMLGLAIGDALGATNAFAPRDAHPPVTDLVGGGLFGRAAGEWGEHTAMTLCLGDSLRAAPDFAPTDFMDRLVAWADQGMTGMPTGPAEVGYTTSSAIERYRWTGWTAESEPAPRPIDAESVVRVAPVAIRWWSNPATAESFARVQSRVTHGAPASLDASALLARCLTTGLRGGRPTESLMPGGDPGWCAPVQALAQGTWKPKRREAIETAGDAFDLLEAAMWAVYHAGNFREAVLTAVNLGNFADATGALAGQLAGALYGAAAIPTVWSRKLMRGDRLRAVAMALSAPDANWAQGT